MARADAGDGGPGGPGGPAVPYIGAQISLLSKSEIRYEGTLCTIDTQAATVSLQHVRHFGTEGRRAGIAPEILPSRDIYEFITFRGADIKDLKVLDEAQYPPRHPALQDPAIVAAPQPVNAQNSAFAPAQFHQRQQPPHPLEQSSLPAQPPARPQNAQPPPRPAHNSSTSETKQQAPSGSASASAAAPSGPNPAASPVRAWGPPPVRTSPPAGPSAEPGQTGASPGAHTSEPLADSASKTTPNRTANSSKTSRPVRTTSASASATRSSNPRSAGSGRGAGRGGIAGVRTRGPGIDVPDEEFDFTTMNEKFDKSTLEDVSVPETTKVAKAYDKTSGFFDDLSFEKDAPQSSRERRQSDFETFGETTMYRSNYRGRGGRGRGVGRGRGGPQPRRGQGRQNGSGGNPGPTTAGSGPGARTARAS